MNHEDSIAAAASLVIGYLIGGIPFGFIIGRLRGIDIRTTGSGNIGATNLGRALGPTWGRIALALDIAKGLVPVLMLAPVVSVVFASENYYVAHATMGFGAILGHIFTPYLFFRGGKGVATTIGVFAALVHVWIAVPLVGYYIVRKKSGYVSAGSITLAVLLPASAALCYRSELALAWPVVASAGATGVLVLIRHVSNIKRLVRGEENAAPQKTGTDTRADAGEKP
jgi:glycerol-3-phosphate acyltransferase PlsY